MLLIGEDTSRKGRLLLADGSIVWRKYAEWNDIRQRLFGNDPKLTLN